MLNAVIYTVIDSFIELLEQIKKGINSEYFQHREATA
jgi:hypothetical protein